MSEAPPSRAALIDQLWYGKDPFSSRGSFHVPVDHQGWNSLHQYFERAVREVRPKLIVEVGVWKGGSVISLAEQVRDQGLDAQVIAIDTWLGSAEHWVTPEFHQGMMYDAGYPRLFRTFGANVFDKGLAEYVVPLPMDSVNALRVLTHYGIRPDIIHIDAGHDLASVTSDLKAWWPILAPGGVLIGDDYSADRSIWPEVGLAFDTFFASEAHALFESFPYKCFVKKNAIW